MIPITKVYVDYEGVVRMSPTGWPEEQDFWSYDGGQSESFNRSGFEYELQKANEESIPFEDQEFFEDCKGMVLGEFYTIEPVEVEIGYQYKYHRDSIEWTDCHISVYQEYKSESNRTRKFARILPKVEKPTQQLCKQCGIEIVEARHTAPSVVHNFCSSKCTQQVYDNATQPAPVVDKPRCECELFLEKYYGFSSQSLTGRSKINTDYGDLVNLLAMFRDELKQQPTEWILVSELENSALQSWKNRYINLDPENWQDEIRAYTIAFIDGVNFTKPLPQPPKI